MIELLRYSREEYLGKELGKSVFSKMLKPAGRLFGNCSRKAISVAKTYRSKPKTEKSGKWKLSATSLKKITIN
jgi:hypothetical protein